MKLTESHLKLFYTINGRGIGRGCNDLNPEELALLTKAQWIEFRNAVFYKSPKDFDNEMPNHLMDWMVVNYIIEELVTSYKGQNNG